MPAPRKPKTTIREANRAESAEPIAGAEIRGPKARAKANPPVETITVELPKELPEGVEFGYSQKFGAWLWTVKSKKANRALIEMARSMHGSR